MSKQFRVRGINPMGRIVEYVMVASTADDAKQAAQDTGLKFVVVAEEPPLLKEEDEERLFGNRLKAKTPA